MKLSSKIKLAKIYFKLTFVEFPRFIRNSKAIPKDERYIHLKNLTEDTQLVKSTQYEHVRENAITRLKANPITKGVNWESYGL